MRHKGFVWGWPRSCPSLLDQKACGVIRPTKRTDTAELIKGKPLLLPQLSSKSLCPIVSLPSLHITTHTTVLFSVLDWTASSDPGPCSEKVMAWPKKKSLF